MISSLPLTKLKQQAEYKQRPLKIRQQQYQKTQKDFKNRMASIIQKSWRNYTIHKQRIQQDIIKRLISNLNKVSLQISSNFKENYDLQNQIKDMQNGFDELVNEQKQKQLNRVTSIFKKTFNSIIQHEIQHKYIEQQLEIAKQNYAQSQNILEQLIECSLVLEKQEQQIIRKDRQYQHNIKQLEQTIMKQTLQINHLEFQYQQLVCKRRKKEIETRFKQYLQ